MGCFCVACCAWRNAIVQIQRLARLRHALRPALALAWRCGHVDPSFRWASVRSRRRRGEEGDRLFDFRAAALWASVLFFTLRITAHHLEKFPAFRALEFINWHCARPPELSTHRLVLDLTLDPETVSVNPVRPVGSGMIVVWASFPSTYARSSRRDSISA